VGARRSRPSTAACRLKKISQSQQRAAADCGCLRERVTRGGRREHPHRDLDPDTRGCQECRRRIRPSSGADDVELTAVQRVKWIVDGCLETSGIVAVVGFTRTFTSL